MKLEQLVKLFSNEHYLDYKNIDSWLCGSRKEELKNIKSIIFFPKKEDIIKQRYSKDTEEEIWTTRPTLDRILTKLAAIGVLCEIETKEGLFGNKVVFCKSQHERLVRAYYDRAISQVEYTESKEQPRRKRDKIRNWGLERIDDNGTI